MLIAVEWKKEGLMNCLVGCLMVEERKEAGRRGGIVCAVCLIIDRGAESKLWWGRETEAAVRLGRFAILRKLSFLF